MRDRGSTSLADNEVSSRCMIVGLGLFVEIPRVSMANRAADRLRDLELVEDSSLGSIWILVGVLNIPSLSPGPWERDRPRVVVISNSTEAGMIFSIAFLCSFKL